ncbi:hypothetical protein CSKR_101996 [Clonorchis sinensis]|uniref:Uncharacterized protein n=1 Tax=Clonorchis sinensis TaxID=79923 RepID=A0A419QBV5_CLOSI|nr:hypothetical protein CSKR_101996 [Clonorchis sinensis]
MTLTPDRLVARVLIVKGSRCSWSDCSALAFLARLRLVERRSSQCSPRDHSNTQARSPGQGGSFRSGSEKLGQPSSIPALVLPSGGMAVTHQKELTAEQFFKNTGQRLRSHS